MNGIILIGAAAAIFISYLIKSDNTPGEVINHPVVNEPEKLPEEVPQISIAITPAKIIQGEPILVTINGTTTVKSLTFKNKPVSTFIHNGKLSALIGIDLREVVGTYPLIATFNDNTTVRKDIVVGKRVMVTAPFGIPEKLGGNTPESEKNLGESLIQESILINSIPTGPAKLWNETFRLPLEGEVAVTDTYGYSRITGTSAFAHKGTDFRATIGTPVYAMNSGTVRYVGYLRNYGNAIVIDHGLGLQTIYMHLSEVYVKNNDNIAKGELVGKSGDTGYVLGPHLHISVKIDRVSIDPMKFMEILGDI